jgi:radical SAM protein with 4Fe4S-binding SPASM domain
MRTPPLRLVAFEVTRTCNLNCRHCRGNSQNIHYPDELAFHEITAILDNIASFSKPIIIITGGEPLTRPDIFDITSHSSSLGLRTVLATCGHFLTEESVRELIRTGVSRISVSLDGATPQSHNTFRGVPGAFESALKGLRNARNCGLDFQINSTFTRINVSELESLHDLAVLLGAVAFHPFLLVPMGRGSSLTNVELTPEEYENALIRIAGIAETSPIEIKPTCSPHYSRILRQLKIQGIKQKTSDKGISHFHSFTKGCLGGQGFVFISYTGKVQMCGFLETEAGDSRASNYAIKSIWRNSDFFKRIRDIDSYRGKCGQCGFRKVCGGCRARAYYRTGDFLAEEPNCLYSPQEEIDIEKNN